MNLTFEERCANKANHPWRVVMSSDDSYDSGSIVNWCPVCGCIAVDYAVDGRVVRCGKIQTTELAVEAARHV